MASPVRSPEHGLIVPATLAFVALGVYAFVFRVSGVPDSYWMMFDQIRDWDRAQSGLTDLPLHGTERSGGGHHWGPTYYWWLWLVRSTLGRALDNLPHAAGIAVAALDSATFAFLAAAIWRAGAPLVATLAAAVLWATLPYPAALARVGWNPAFALALTSFCLALASTWSGRLSLAHVALLCALSVGAVHAHTGSISFFLALCAVLVWQGYRSRQLTGTVVTIVATVVVLQVPMVLEYLRRPDDSPTAIGQTVLGVFSGEALGTMFRGAVFVAVEGPILLLSALPERILTFGGFLLLGVMAFSAKCVVFGSQAARIVIALSVATVALSVMSYTVVQETPQRYWLLLIVPPSFVLFAFGLGEIQRLGRPGAIVVGAVLVAVLAAQPKLWTISSLTHRYPPYGLVVEAARDLRGRDVEIRMLVGPADHRMPTQSTAVYRWLGGRVSESSPNVAVVKGSGELEVVRVPLPPSSEPR